MMKLNGKFSSSSVVAVKSLSPIIILISSILVLGLEPHDGAIVSPESTQENVGQPPINSHTPTTKNVRFALITTGDQIKLYPFQHQGDQLSLSHEFYFLIKPTPLKSHELDKFGNSSYANWLREQQQLRTKKDYQPHNSTTTIDCIINDNMTTISQPQSSSSSSTRASILPRGDQDENEPMTDNANPNDYSSGNSGFRKPWYSNVDYFFDDRFCSATPTMTINNNNNKTFVTPSNNYNSINYNQENVIGDNNGELVRDQNNISQDGDLYHNEGLNNLRSNSINNPMSRSSCLVVVLLDANNHLLQLAKLDLSSISAQLTGAQARQEPEKWAPVETKAQTTTSTTPLVLDDDHDTTRRPNMTTTFNNTVTMQQHHQAHSRKTAANHSPLLFMDQLPPIDIYKSLETITGQPFVPIEQRRVFGLTVDKRSNVIHVAFTNGSGQPNRILSGLVRLTTGLNQQQAADSTFNTNVSTLDDAVDDEDSGDRGEGDVDDSRQLEGETIHSFNECPDGDLMTNSQQDSTTSDNLMNLQVDEEVGDWLFYFDKSTSNIYALNLINNNYLRSKETGGLARATQILVKSIPSDSSNTNSNSNNNNNNNLLVNIKHNNNNHNHHHYHHNRLQFPLQQDGSASTPSISLRKSIIYSKITAPQSIGVALNPHNNRLYWLSAANELFSCDCSGQEPKLEAKLSLRPSIRAPYTLQIFGDRLYIVDRSKWSLVTYNLSYWPQDFQAQLKLSSSSSSSSFVDNSDHININDPTHKVLLIERYSLLDVAFVDLNGRSEHPSEYYQYDFREFWKRESQLEVYAELLDNSRPICVTNMNHANKRNLQTNSSMLVDQADRERYMYFTIELTILYFVFLIWLSVPWIKSKIIDSRNRNLNNSQQQFHHHNNHDHIINYDCRNQQFNDNSSSSNYDLPSKSLQH